MKLIDKVLKENKKITYYKIINDLCPSRFGYEDLCKAPGNYNLDCHECWSRELLNDGRK